MSDQDMQDLVSDEQEIPEPTAETPARQLDLDAVELTDVGRVRPHNEDYVDSFVPPDSGQLESKGAIYLVADGMGGHQAGEVASRGAVELVISQYYSDSGHDVGTSLVRAFRAANKLIYEQSEADPAKAGMGTTLVAAVVLGRRVYLANVGDSRAYLVNRSGIAQITEDHSWVEEQVRAGLLTAEQANHHPQRNLLTRALGTKPDVDVDLFEGELGEGDMLLMCTDGLTGRVEDPEISAVVREHPPEAAARLLVSLANERGGNDNITVLIVSDHKGAPTMAVPLAAGAAAPAVATEAVPIKKQPSQKKFPLIPVLVGVAGVLVLLLGGLLIVPLLTGGDPTPTPTAPPALATATDSVQVEPTVTVAATESPAESASPTSEPTSSEPTATLAATFTPAPPTMTPRPTESVPTATPEPTADTPQAQYPPATLSDPAAESELRGDIVFNWDYSPFPLKLGDAFQVLIWKEGDVAHYGAATFTRRRSQQIDVDEVPQVKAGGAGTYYWTVVVVDKQTDQRVSSEAEARRFTYPGPQGPGGGPGGSGGSPGEKPTPTPRP